MKKIETYEQLQEEKRLSKQKIAHLELLIKEDFAELKESLTPLNLAGKAVKNVITSNNNNSVVSESINLTVDTIIKKLLLRRSNWMFKLAVAFFLKNYTKNLVSRNADSIVHWVTSKIKKARDNYSDNYREESTTADVEWDT